MLLQTLALFETLLSKIQTMKTETETITTENERLTTCLQTKCSVEDDLKLSEAKLTAVNEVRMDRIVKYMKEIPWYCKTILYHVYFVIL